MCFRRQFVSTVSEKLDRWLLARFCAGTWSSGASQVARSAPCLPYPPSFWNWEVLGYQKGILTWDPWDQLRRHLVTPHSTLQSWLILAALFWSAHNGDMHTETYSAKRHAAFLWALQCTEHPSAFPYSHIHSYSHAHGENNPAVCVTQNNCSLQLQR